MEESRPVLVLGAGNDNIGAAIATELKVRGKQVHTVDKSDFDVRYKLALAETIRDINPDHVVYSVGVNRLDYVEEIAYDEWRRITDINVWGFVQTVQALWRWDRRPRSVVAIGSDAAWRPMRTSLAYCASKAALEMAVKVASRELASKGWRVNCVSPGKVEDTPMTDYVDKRVLELRGWTATNAERYELASTPLGRKVDKEEVARVTSDVLLSEARAWTGAVIPVNGGR